MDERLNIKRWRWDRSPEEHLYGEEVDALLAELVGGDENFDRESLNPVARVPATTCIVELHEDGPEIWVEMIKQIPPMLTALAALWTAWKIRSEEGTKKEAAKHGIKAEDLPIGTQRGELRVSYRGNTFSGDPTSEDENSPDCELGPPGWEPRSRPDRQCKLAEASRVRSYRGGRSVSITVMSALRERTASPVLVAISRIQSTAEAS